jgi:hypothetical protein
MRRRTLMNPRLRPPAGGLASLSRLSACRKRSDWNERTAWPKCRLERAVNLIRTCGQQLPRQAAAGCKPTPVVSEAVGSPPLPGRPAERSTP